jgi:hypothetical protein
MRRLLIACTLSTAIAALAGPLSSTAAAFGPCSKQTFFYNISNGGYIVAVHPGGILEADQGSYWGTPELFQSCFTGKGQRIAIYSDYTGRWVGDYWWVPGDYLYAEDTEINTRDEFEIPWWTNNEYMFSVRWALAGYGWPVIAGEPFALNVLPGGGGDSQFWYGWLGCPSC